jgi:hypothetical protein
MIDPTDTTLERDLQPAPPRRVRASGHAVLLCVTAVLLLTAFGACGLAAIGEAARLQFLHWRGHTAVATIIKTEYAGGAIHSQPTDLDSASPTGYLYRFTTTDYRSVEGLLPAAGARLDMRGAAAKKPLLALGSTFRVRYAKIEDRVVSRPSFSTTPDKVVSLTIVGLASTAIGVGLFWQCMGWLRRCYRLVKTGNVAIGTVLGKEAAAEDSPKFYIAFSYTTADDVVRFCRVPCSSAQYQSFREGQTLSVVYSAHRPGEATPYALLPFCP